MNTPDQPAARANRQVRPNAPAAPRRFVTLREVAARWKVHRSTARRILDRGAVRPYALGGARSGTLRYDLREVIAFENRRREDAP